MTNADDIRDVFDKAMPALRYPLRGVVTCAGVPEIAMDCSVDTFRRVVDVNLVGTFIVVLKSIRKKKPIGIVTRASTTPHTILPSQLSCSWGALSLQYGAASLDIL